MKFAAAGPGKPVFDYETRSSKVDENGVALLNVRLFAAGSGVKDSITVKASGKPKHLSEFILIKIANIIFATW